MEKHIDVQQLEQKLQRILESHLSGIIAKSVLALSVSRSGVDLAKLETGDDKHLMKELENGIRLYVDSPSSQEKCLEELLCALATKSQKSTEIETEQVVPIETEADIVTARSGARLVCEKIGFSLASQIKVSTAVSELARNIVQYAGKGKIIVTTVFENDRRGIEVSASDGGPGIENLKTILDGNYRSRSGMGKGLTGTRALMDEFDIQTETEKGTKIVVRKYVA